MEIPGFALNPELAPPLGADEMCAYIGCAGGVDSTKDASRASTHGGKGIAKRVGMPVRRTDNALQNLEAAGFLQRFPETQFMTPSHKRVVGDITWQVDRDKLCDLCVSQDFLQSADIQRPAGEEFKRETLGHLCENIDIEIEGGISRSNALADAIAVFFVLHKHLDFDRFGGVDPRIASGDCTPIQDKQDSKAGTYMKPVTGVPKFTLVSVKRPQQVVFSPTFITATLGSLPTWDKAPSLPARFALAVKQLENSGLIYDALVLWESCPKGPPTMRYPDPISTLYVPSLRDEKLEHRLSDATHTAIIDSQTSVVSEIFRVDHSGKHHLAHRGIYRYIVPQSQVLTAKLLLQLRVRRWAYNEENVTALQADQVRVRRQKAILAEVVAQSKASKAALLRESAAC